VHSANEANISENPASQAAVVLGLASIDDDSGTSRPMSRR
jgi:hypothetical protein